MFKKILSGCVAVIATLGLAFSLVGVGVSNAAGETKPSEGETPVGNATTSSSMLVPPWCGWRISSLSEAIDLQPASGEPNFYSGEEIQLEATGADIYAYIGGSAEATSKPESDLALGACSWFSDPAYGAQLNVVLDDANFTAEAESGGLDSQMDFSAEQTENELYVSYVPAEEGSCSADGFTPGDMSSFYPDRLSGRVWSVAAADALNNNFCQFRLSYQIKIPAGMSPTYGETTYTWTGPTLTFTLQVPEDSED